MIKCYGIHKVGIILNRRFKELSLNLDPFLLNTRQLCVKMHIIALQDLQQIHSYGFNLWRVCVCGQELHINIVPVHKVIIKALPFTIQFSYIIGGNEVVIMFDNLWKLSHKQHGQFVQLKCIPRQPWVRSALVQLVY